MRTSSALSVLGLAASVAAHGANGHVWKRGEGSLDGSTTSADAAGYSCDPKQCKLPDCHCASTDPPGGLSPSDTPMFVVFTADDAVQSYTLDAINQFLDQRKNPNGCKPRATYYTSLSYTNYTLVTDWYVAGNEIADHTMTHVGDPPKEEVEGNLITLNALAGIPKSSIQGFRAPFLNYSVNTLKMLHDMGFTYDSSATSSIPVTDPGTDAYWPYTLDNGLANDCLSVPNICKGEPKLPGFWEVPMYALFDDRGVAGPHLMDPWLDGANGKTDVDNAATLDYMKKTFTAHYENKRQPIGLYTHPIHVSKSVPGSTVTDEMIKMINDFIDFAQSHENVWIVSSEQLLAWMKNPTKNSDLNNFGPLKCTTPNVDPKMKICNGIPQNEQSLLQLCPFSDAPFYTCYGCPTKQPSVAEPNPPQATSSAAARVRISDSCDTAFWDPIKGDCICKDADCAFTDHSGPIGSAPNSTSSGAPSPTNSDSQAPSGSNGPSGPSPSSTDAPGKSGALRTLPSGFFAALAIGTVGAVLGVTGVILRI